MDTEAVLPTQMSPQDLAFLRQQLVAAMGPGIGVACTGVDGDQKLLWPVERATIRLAVPRRQREFAAGRWAAREAITQIGRAPSAIPSAPDRSPIWPEGLVGSIAHTGRTCVAIAGRRDHVYAMGIDIEEDIPLDPDLWESICTPEELAAVASLPRSERGQWVTRLFCAKEAFYKWQYPQTRCMLDFRDVQVTQLRDRSGFVAHACISTLSPVLKCQHEGRLMIIQDLVLAWLIGAPA